MAEKLTRTQILNRWSFLKNERSSWHAHWQDISRYLLPRTGRFFVEDRNRGDKRHNNIYDSTGTRALRTLAAGMMAGMTSPARPWFRLSTSDPELDESHDVKKWLADVTRLMQMVFAKSNTYRALHAGYEELGAYGTWASVMMDDFDTVIHHYPLTAGEFCLAADYRGVVNTLYREFEMTSAQVADEYGIKNCSATVRSLLDAGKPDAPVRLVHCIEPRKDRDPRLKDAQNMPYQSVTIELGSDEKRVLRESGMKQFRVLAPRWATVSGDVYGNGPGMEALGDIKSLQQEQLRKAQGIDHKTKPALQLPSSMKDQVNSIFPGDVVYYDQTSQGGGVRKAIDVDIDLSHLLEDIRDVRERIRGSFYADLFLMLAGNDLGRMTATEVAERHEEKLLMLGPVLERMHNEILMPKIDMTFERMLQVNMVPMPPPELQGMDLNVEFVSMLAQAQRAVATNSIDRFAGNLGMIAGMKPDVLDKFNADQWADEYADMLGISPDLIVPGSEVALIRQQRAEAQQKMAQAEMANQGADTAQKLSNAPTDGKNALTDITRAFSGYT